jgi:tetratricopeptide (TPR) repeat protein
LTKAGAWDEAKIYWNEVLRERPSSGPANLGLARVLAAQSDIDAAIAHYQRAIYGNWNENPEQHQVAARMELIQTLNKAGRRAQAQAELLALIANGPKDAVVRRQIAQTSLQLGMYRQAADLFREVTAGNGRDAAGFHGLGDAEFALGDYGAARDAYRSASEADSSDTAAAQKGDLCQQILDLDPTERGLSARQRFERSRELLGQVGADVAACKQADSLPEDVKLDFEEAQTALAHSPRAGVWNEAEESDLSAAERLWGDRSKVCAGGTSDGPVGYVMGRLGKR